MKNEKNEESKRLIHENKKLKRITPQYFDSKILTRKF